METSGLPLLHSFALIEAWGKRLGEENKGCHASRATVFATPKKSQGMPLDDKVHLLPYSG